MKLLKCFFLFFFTLSFAEEWDRLKDEIITKVLTIPGYTSRNKANFLMDVTKAKKPKILVQIGAFYGANTLPIAATLKYNNKGLLYVIDSWEDSSAYNYFCNLLDEYEVNGFVNILKINQKSNSAIL